MEELVEKTEFTETLRKAILKEKLEREAAANANPLPLILKGKRQEALENLVFFATPRNFSLSVNRLLQQIEVAYPNAMNTVQSEYLAFLTELVLALRSLLPNWNLANSKTHGQEALSQARLEEIAASTQALALRLAGLTPQIEKDFLDKLRGEAAARYKAEQAPDPGEAAQTLVGNSLAECLTNACREISNSQLRRIAEMRFTGQTATELSNDYAAFLQHTLYLGISFATTNPPLVNMALDILPGLWGPIVDEILKDNPTADTALLAKLVTLEVVLTQMRLLRPVFLLTEGRMGCVCFQVDPSKHGDSRGMVADALFFYEKLRSRLGGVPNVVFKFPGTHAGLEACRTLTRQGIGVTITVDFGMFQHIPFAQAILEGQAIYSCLVEMNGRLAFPVRDELLGKLEQLSAFQIDEKASREAAAWAGVFVARRLKQVLGAKNVDPSRIKILIASLRIYHGEMYRGLPDAFPDITGILGAEILSVFPNVRYAYDHSPEIALAPNQIEAPLPEQLLNILLHSEIFKQAYYVVDRDWLPVENETFRPEYVLALEDEEKVFAWPPIYNTLTEFIKSYQTLMQRLEERKQFLTKPEADIPTM
jgi:transaldolase